MKRSFAGGNVLAEISAASMPTPSRATVRRPWTRRALPWLGAGLIAFPAVVLLHELGHYFVFRAFGFPGTVLHYASADFTGSMEFERRLLIGDPAGAAAIVPVYQHALAVVGGLLVTYLSVLLAAWWTARRGIHPLVLAIGLASPLRFLSLRRMLMAVFAGRPVLMRTDEGMLILATGLPPILLIVAGLACWVGGWIYLIRKMPAGDRGLPLAALLVGTVIGAVVYAGYLGPWLLP